MTGDYVASASNVAHRTFRRRALLWLAVGSAALAAAITLAPNRVLVRLPPAAERFRDDLAHGMTVVRLGFLAAGVLALVEIFFPVPSPVAVERKARRLSRADWALAGLTIAITLALAAPAIASSFWWDELTTIVRVVRRGPLVIMSWAAGGNSHTLNSLSMWVMRSLVGEGEVSLRLPALALALATPPVIYFTLLSSCGRGVAAVSALLLSGSFWFVKHGVEARGYSGAILFSYLSCWYYRSLLRQGAASTVVAYVACSVAAVGYMLTMILVPLAHGAVALVLLVWDTSSPDSEGRADERLKYWRAALACLWVAAVSAILFGLPLPSILDFGTDGAGTGYSAGSTLLQSLAQFVTSCPHLIPALAVIAGSAAGWLVIARSDRRLALGFLMPAFTALLFVAVPGMHAESRHLSFLLIPTVIGFAAALVINLKKARPLNFAAAAIFLCIWTLGSASLHKRFLTVGNPDLKGLASRLSGANVVLVGSQSDVNLFYFPEARRLRSIEDLNVSASDLAWADYVVRGFMPKNYKPVALNAPFERRQVLEAWEPTTTAYEVYARVN